MKLDSIGNRGDLLLEGLLAASRSQLSQLSFKAGVLIHCGSAGVADDHFPITRVHDIVIAFLSKYKTNFSESVFKGSGFPSLDLALLREEITRPACRSVFSLPRSVRITDAMPRLAFVSIGGIKARGLKTGQGFPGEYTQDNSRIKEAVSGRPAPAQRPSWIRRAGKEESNLQARRRKGEPGRP